MGEIRKTVCPLDCPDTCSMFVTVDDGRVTQLQGDPEHPFTRGFLCHKVAHYDRRLYSPLRVLYPQRRVGAKGEGKFARISWDEALDEIASRFKAIIAEYGGEAILPYSYGGSLGIVQRLSGHKFFYRLGASRLLRTICDTGAMAGWEMTIGKGISTDLAQAEGSDFVLIWGMNIAATNVHFVPIVKAAKKRGARVVQIDPYRNRTSHLADEQIMPRPGTDGALALGMMHVLIRENLVDRDYIEKYTLGYDELRERVLADYPVERVSSITGVEEEQIVRVARQYGQARAPFLRVGFALTRHENGAMAMRTIACLPGLVGAFRKPGGGAHHETADAFAFNYDRVKGEDLFQPQTREINMVKLGEVLLEEKNPPVKALYVYNCNPAAIAPDQSRVHAGLRRDDLFTVVHEQVSTDTVDFADIVLPAPTFLEYLDLYKSYGHYYLQMGKPVIEPLGESKPNLDVFQLLARRMGFEDTCFTDTEFDIMRQALDTSSDFLAGVDFEKLKAGEPQRLNVKADADPFAGGFFTPSRKLEFYSERMAQQGLDPLPSYQPCSESPENHALQARFPLQLLAPPSVHFLNSSFGAVEEQRRRMGQPSVKINPADAQRRGIAPGDLVRMFNDRGECRYYAEVTDDTREGVVVAEGLWWAKHTPDGRSVNTLVSTRLTDMGAGSTFQCNLVEVAPA
ncbi:MAG TPA: molybdopterin oxidoreductase family protein [Terriglobia bacterium]|nr:molybdopterin oxidoreductase family protein [Terriglobia bacterium]